MGLLAPLYALAALAIAAPVLFHLIRRQPRGQSEFSSLMFLQASPPRLTRRSRLDNIFLLLLRALALGLIAIAFARPFLRSAQLADAQVAGREILILLDTSGSMTREDVWPEAVKTVRDYVDTLGAQDMVALATFDTKFNLRVPFPSRESGDPTEPKEQQSAVKSELSDLKASYRGTKLADQLMSAVELLQERANASSSNESQQFEIVLVSDLHENSGLEALQGFDWPENVRLDVRRVQGKHRGNAFGSVMQANSALTNEPKPRDSATSTATNKDATDKQAAKATTEVAENASSTPKDAVRIRIENSQDAPTSGFQLRWIDDKASATNANSLSMNVQVPPGQVRVVSMTVPSATADRVELTGDATTFDNTIYVPRTTPRKERVAFVGAKRNTSDEDLYFFLSQIPLSTIVRSVDVERMDADKVKSVVIDESVTGLVLEYPFPVSIVDSVLEYAKSGRPVIVVLSRPITTNKNTSETSSPDSPTKTQTETEPTETKTVAKTETDSTNVESLEAALSKLLSTSEVKVSESTIKNYALLTDIDFRHPLFQPLSDSKFNDFGRVRFWAHRNIALPGDVKDAAASSTVQRDYQVIARFDDHAPAMIHRTIGRGDVWILAAGWQTSASQFALSSKFVPILFGMLDPQGRSLQTDAIYEVGERIDVPKGVLVNITRMDGSPVKSAASDSEGLAFDEPGLYLLIEDGKRRQIAIVLPQSESQLDPLDTEKFAQYGAITGKSDSAHERQAAARLSQAHELEGRQKLWRWILVAAVGLLVLETLVAARLQNRFAD